MSEVGEAEKEEAYAVTWLSAWHRAVETDAPVCPAVTTGDMTSITSRHICPHSTFSCIIRERSLGLTALKYNKYKMTRTGEKKSKPESSYKNTAKVTCNRYQTDNTGIAFIWK